MVLQNIAKINVCDAKTGQPEGHEYINMIVKANLAYRKFTRRGKILEVKIMQKEKCKFMVIEQLNCSDFDWCYNLQLDMDREG